MLSHASATEFENALATVLTNHGAADTSPNEKFEKLYASIAQRIKTVQVRRKRRLLSWLPYAAAASIIVASAITIYINHTSKRPSAAQGTLAMEDDILPGGNRATLTLAGGQVIALDERKNRVIMADGVRYQDGQSIDSTSQIDRKNTLNKPKAAWLELSTPRGGTYEIVLSDGTQVWLNAESALRYPEHFTGAERVVFLTGEAFFSVAKDEQLPFKVISDSQEVEVLGTEFNVSAYPAASQPIATKTTVVEGRVMVSDRNNAGHKGAVYLQPGQQSIHTSNAGITVRDVAVASFIGWKNGLFYFDETPIEDALSQLARWYDLDIRYEGTTPQTHFYGQISRDKSLKQALGILEESGIRFDIQKEENSNTLVVLPR